MQPKSPLHRIARAPDPWAPPDWAFVGDDGTFGNRFDDPDSTYRVLYASSQRLGCFLETLARFRPDPKLAAELAAIAGDDDFRPLGSIPASWLTKRRIGTAVVSGDFADICSARWLGKLRTQLARYLPQLGLSGAEVDASLLQRSAPRRLTQLVSRIAFAAEFQGVFYRSKYGHDVENWALFEPFDLAPGKAQTIVKNDTDLAEAMRIHGLELAERPC